MKSKLVIFIVAGTLLVAAIYSSSPFVAFGAGHCYVSARNPADYICTFTNKDGKITAVYYCPNYQGHGGCISVYSTSTGSDTGSGIPSEVRNALDAAIGKSQNTTKVPKGSFLNDGGLLKGQSDNQTTSQRIVDPEDRFCMEGTGGQTGTPCVHCNPGKVDCIDVVTSGLLDTPDTATSESGKNNDTKGPKDLGGLNDDENGPSANPGE